MSRETTSELFDLFPLTVCGTCIPFKAMGALGTEIKKPFFCIGKI